jgi:hypothetical protein
MDETNKRESISKAKERPHHLLICGGGSYIMAKHSTILKSIQKLVSNTLGCHQLSQVKGIIWVTE